MTATLSTIPTTATGIAVHSPRPDTLHTVTLPLPTMGPNDVLVRTIRAGICGTDREIIDGDIGRPPPDSDVLVIGHEVLGRVEATGSNVDGFRPGDLVSATVRRPDGCPACEAGQPDFCVWRNYSERGIFNLHGFMIDHWMEAAEYLVPMPDALEGSGVLLEPLSVVEKAYRQAVAVQRRIISWNPRMAVVLGAGPIGVLQAMLLRERGMDVVVVARAPSPTAASEIVEATGARYVSSQETDLATLGAQLPNVDLIIEATGKSEIVVAAMEMLGNNGVLVLLSITGGHATFATPMDLINRELVLGNKLVVGSVNSAHEDFVTGIDRLLRFEKLWPGLAESIITRRLTSLEDVVDGGTARDGVKTVVEFAE